MQLEELGEFGLIERIFGQAGAGGAGVLLGIGDDTAVMQITPGSVLLATCDSQVDGHHFRRQEISPEQLGRRLAAVNLSDIGAMGGSPRWALASLMLPSDTEARFIEALYSGLIEELSRFGASIIGGNIAGAEQLVLDLTLLGEARPDQILRRSGARPGDAIFVTGTLGASAAGRAALDARLQTTEAAAAIAIHLRPEPRVRAGQAIARSGVATAMLDISDGLARDLGHICDASHAGAVIEATHLPVSTATRAVAAVLGQDPLRLALGGGEDYELLCTVPDAAAATLTSRVEQEAGITLTRIGSILPAGEGRWLQHPDGHRSQLTSLGWQHFGSRDR